MKTSAEIKDWNSWVEDNYPRLIGAARKIHAEPHDLVHHTYLRIHRLNGVNLTNVMKNPMGYFCRAMFIEATRGQFKDLYELNDYPEYDQESDYDLSHAFMLENFELAVDRLSWFDRTVLRLFADGWNMSQVSRESGINSTTFWTSLHRSRIKLKKFFHAL